MKSLKAAFTDIDLQEQVLAELALDPAVDSIRIRVAATDGSIALSGTARSYPEKLAAIEAAARVRGVKAVADDIEVELPRSLRRADAQIAAELARERESSDSIPKSIRIEVSKGRVTLRGVVESATQRDEAARAVTHIAGVTSISNLIETHPHLEVTPDYVERLIQQALEQLAELDAESIRVTTSDGVVRLRGSVHSFAERRAAERAAESAPGVTKVENEILVRP